LIPDFRFQISDCRAKAAVYLESEIWNLKSIQTCPDPPPQQKAGEKCGLTIVVFMRAACRLP